MYSSKLLLIMCSCVCVCVCVCVHACVIVFGICIDVDFMHIIISNLEV